MIKERVSCFTFLCLKMVTILRGDFMKSKKDRHGCNKEEEGIMSTVAKPNTRAFVLKTDKVDQFVKKEGVSDKVMERFHAHKPRYGVITPLKGKDV